MSGVMRITKRWIRSEMRGLAKETGMELYLEEYSDQRKNLFTLHQTDENGTVIKTLIGDYYTTREMYLSLKAAREIYRAASLPSPNQKV